MVGGEVIDLAAETDAVMDGLERLRARQLASTPGSRSWEDGYQYLSAWRLTNEALVQRKEKMSGSGGDGGGDSVHANGSMDIATFMNPSVLRTIQLGFAYHAADILRKTAAAAKHRTASYAAQRRPEFVAVGEDPRRGLGDIRKAAEKVAQDKAAAEREELMKKAQSKRADEETRAAAQKVRAEVAGQNAAVAANKALAATLGGRDAKWSKWGGGLGGGGGKGDAKTKGAHHAGVASDKEKEEEGNSTLASSKSRAALTSASAAAAAATNATGGTGAGDSNDLQVQDLIVALKQDPRYCKSPLLYRLLNGLYSS